MFRHFIITIKIHWKIKIRKVNIIVIQIRLILMKYYIPTQIHSPYQVSMNSSNFKLLEAYICLEGAAVAYV